MTVKANRYDVAIIGAGMGGSVLGAALSRNGVRVLLIDHGVHPRFAVGEAATPYTNVSQRIIAARYNLPELTTLCTLKDCAKNVSPAFGAQAHSGFLRHEEGKPQDPRETNQFHTPGPLHEAHHLYRQDVDAWVFHLAVKTGCTPLQNYRIADLDFGDSGVTVHGEDGSAYRARYVVDASGQRSPLAEKFGLREEIPRYKHQSRSMYTHVMGITHTDKLWDRKPEHTPPVPWYEGTVHHTFNRGWAWAIGFDNTPLSRNPLCSIGLTVDPRVYPKNPNLSAEDDFADITSRFPDIERQYAGVAPVREWVSTDRLQYSSTQTVGDRWCLLSDAAAFIDPLFSYGLANTGDAINRLAWRLIRACQDDDFSAERFDEFEQWQQARFHYNDEIVNAGFTAFDHFDFWKAVFRVWVWGNSYGTVRARAGLTEYQKDARDSHFQDLEKGQYVGFDWPDHEGFKHLFDTMVTQVDAFQAGKIAAHDASEALWAELEAADVFPKPFGFQDRSVHFMSPKPPVIAKSALWLSRHGDPQVRRMLMKSGRQAIRQRLSGSKIF
ncbi:MULTISPECIES: NAD(P)/FAD-dependent oxidoreductase [unclassified Streptomyces]|uniref:NAD(P)/FAD-dependent oxidoreductase n=1 Tax=unclassified Streptomyces TaxID=2593676 RepID=UPI0022B6179B|nr:MULTISPECIES: tryptophan 7-halogenase [unclassified Streptomyces]MCZ7413499.1 tryptophan 7-halogenase [Streptomyces sp. WMMC897]MCZ7430493.1 tryptophan 7-halogenase [Streptomyces sp. WMMC1477]